MKRVTVSPRTDWKKTVTSQGLLYNTNEDGSIYWDESACYQFTLNEIESLEKASNDLHQMFIAAVSDVISKNRFDELGIPKGLHSLIQQSWVEDNWEFYGRFDFTFVNGIPKMLEYNADTPSGLLEASVIQWNWKNDLFRSNDQFNSLHESLVGRWKVLAERGQLNIDIPLYHTSTKGHVEDRMISGYIAECAMQAGFEVPYIAISDIGLERNTYSFYDLEDNEILQIFKLYPWEWLSQEAFGDVLAYAKWKVIEPAWKSVIASKGLLLVLQELYPDHPNLLKVSSKPLEGSYVKKPFFGREGKNIEVRENGLLKDTTDGNYSGEKFIYQEYAPLFKDDDNYSQVGVWMVGPEAHGMGVREDTRPIMGNTSRFIPHIIV